MKVTLWGTRGSLPSPGQSTAHFGGNTSCVQVTAKDGTSLILDAGSGIRLLGETLAKETQRIDILLTHLHMDHLQGLGFFTPLYIPNREVHIWGPPSFTKNLTERLKLYLAPPLFPVKMRDLACKLTIHNVPLEEFKIGPFSIKAEFICHPDLTLGFRISEQGSTLAYIPDHEPALGSCQFPNLPEWTSGLAIAKEADLLIHDSQYTQEEYPSRVGWGHSALEDALQFAKMAKVKKFIAFHHDPTHDDKTIDLLIRKAQESGFPFEIVGGAEGDCYEF